MPNSTIDRRCRTTVTAVQQMAVFAQFFACLLLDPHAIFCRPFVQLLVFVPPAPSGLAVGNS
ncbi:MAG: hypothetical protein ABL904_27640 [Hyphomicrobiaceae bacterium]